MHTDYLVQQANRIARFFEAMPERGEAQAGVANHIRKFWEPRMRRQLAEHLATGGEGLLPLVKEALALAPDLHA